MGRGGAAAHHPAAAQDHGGVQEVGNEEQVLVVIDDFADTPQLHGALDTLFIRGRHISTWVSSQKLRLISAAVRVQHAIFVLLEAAQPARAGCRHRGAERTAAEGAAVPAVRAATREPDSFLFVYYLKPKNEMSVSRLRKTPMGAALSFLGQKLFASSTLINAKCENISSQLSSRPSFAGRVAS